jgi:hypothetical protein
LTLSSWLPSGLSIDRLSLTVEYRVLHAVLDTAFLPVLRSLRIACLDHQIIFVDAYRDEVLHRLDLPALEDVEVEICSKFAVTEADLLSPFASAASLGILRADVKFRGLYWYVFNCLA